MDVHEFDYELPAGQIAQRPLAERDASRLLLLGRANGEWEDRQFRELPEILRGDELMVLNNARVWPARLFGRRAGIHAQPLGKRDPARNEFLQRESRSCWCGNCLRILGKPWCARDARFPPANGSCLGTENWMRR